MLTGLMRRRDQHLAHADANPTLGDPLLLGEFDSLVDEVKSAFNWLSREHDGHRVSWQNSVRNVERDATEVLGILRGDMERKQREHQEEMVRIVLEELRRRETLVGRPLDKREIRSLKQSFGLTGEELRRIEEERGLS